MTQYEGRLWPYQIVSKQKGLFTSPQLLFKNRTIYFVINSRINQFHIENIILGPHASLPDMHKIVSNKSSVLAIGWIAEVFFGGKCMGSETDTSPSESSSSSSEDIRIFKRWAYEIVLVDNVN